MYRENQVIKRVKSVALICALLHTLIFISFHSGPKGVTTSFWKSTFIHWYCIPIFAFFKWEGANSPEGSTTLVVVFLFVERTCRLALNFFNYMHCSCDTIWMCEYSQEGRKHQQLCSERIFFHLQWFLLFSEPVTFTQCLPFFNVAVSGWCFCHCCSSEV